MEGDKQGEEVWCNAGWDQQANLTLQKTEGWALKPWPTLRNKQLHYYHNNMNISISGIFNYLPVFCLQWHSYNWRNWSKVQRQQCPQRRCSPGTRMERAGCSLLLCPCQKPERWPSLPQPSESLTYTNNITDRTNPYPKGCSVGFRFLLWLVKRFVLNVVRLTVTPAIGS